MSLRERHSATHQNESHQIVSRKGAIDGPDGLDPRAATIVMATPYSFPSLLLRLCQADRHRSNQLRSFSRRALKRCTHLCEQRAVR